MFGFGGGFNGPGGGSTNSGSAPSGGAGGKAAEKGGRVGSSVSSDPRGMDSRGGGSTPSPNTSGSKSSSAGSREATAGREGAGGGPGGPAGTGRTSGTNAGSNAGREGQRAGPGNPGAGGGVAEKGDRLGGTQGRVGFGSFSTPSPSPDINPARFGPAPTPVGIGPSIPDRTFRASEVASMDAYSAAAANSAANAMRASTAQAARAAEDASMSPFNTAGNTFYATTKAPEAGLLDPFNRLPTGKGPDYADVTNMTIDEAADYASAMTGKSAHVIGGFQFKDTTLRSIADDMGIPRSTKMSPEVQTQLAKGLAQRRANEATVKGKVDKEKFAREMAKEWASFATSYGMSFYDANGVDKAGVSYGDVKAMTDAMVDTGFVGPNRNLASMGDDPAPTAGAIGKPPGAAVSKYDPRTVTAATQKMADRFAATYLGDRPNESKEEAYFGSTPDHNWPGNAAMAAKNPETYGTPAQPETQIGPPNGDLSKFPPAPEERRQQRSVVGTLLAGGIDVVATLAPGVGPYVGVANAGLALTGNRTIGEFMSDSIMNGDNTYQPGSATADSGSRADRYVPEPAPIKKAGATVKTPAFADKYLSDTVYVDPIKRPTPAQKWGEGSDTYGSREYA